MSCRETRETLLDTCTLYDHAGNQVAIDSSNDREPVVSFTPQATDTYYIVVHASKLNDGTKPGSISTAVTYK